MARTRRSAKQAGARFEREIADHLRDNLDHRIDRKVRTGAKDTGDIANVYDSHGNKVTIEVKNTTRMALPAWSKEAHAEAQNDGGLVGIVVSKRHGVGAPGQQWVHCTLDDLIALLDPPKKGTTA